METKIKTIIKENTVQMNLSPFEIKQLRVLNKCVNLLTKNGKKTKAFSLVNGALSLVIKKTRKSSSFWAQPRQSGSSVGTSRTESKTKREQSGPSVRETHVSGNPREEIFIANVLFLQSIENVKPIFEVKKVRVAGNTLLVPALISFHRQENKALRWIIEGAQEKKKKICTFLFSRMSCG